MDFKLIGSILLIVGTSVGAGILGLPVATAELGFLGAFILLVVCWFIMTMGALLILEVNLWLPQNSNLISMARVTIGPVGQIIAWLTYLLLLYSLLAAYIAGGSDLLHNLMVDAGIKIPAQVSAIVFTLIFGYIVYRGIRVVDLVNRGLMSVKLGSLFITILLLIPFISGTKLAQGNLHNLISIEAITVTITAFGYATIVPSLRIYFAGDVHKLRWAIVLGSFIPLICYILWDLAIMGVLSLDGEHGLKTIFHASSSSSALVNSLIVTTNNEAINIFVKLFTSICVLTSFLGVALCLTDFFADGLALEKTGIKNNVIVYGITFIPPLLAALFFQNVFITGLMYAGIYSVILLILLPSWMAWQGRYRTHLAKGYQVSGGKPLLLLLIVFSIVMIALSIWAAIGTTS